MRRGRKVRFLVPEDRGEAAWLHALPPAAVVPAPLRHKSRYRLRALAAAADVRRIAALRSLLRSLRPRGLIVNQPDAEDGVALARAARAEGIPAAALLHLPQDLDELGATRLLLLRRLLARRSYASVYERVVTVSEASARTARRNWTQKAVVAVNGIEIPEPAGPGEREAARRELGIAPGAASIAGLARLVPEKGFGELIGIFGAIRAAVPGTELVIAGEGPQRAELERAIGAAGLQGSARLVGFRPARRVLLAADVLAMPTRYEGLPLTLLEAGALGTDVIAYAVDGIPEVLEPSALVTPGDREELAAKLILALRDRASRDARTVRLRATVLAKHSIDRMAERFEAALGWV